jgi:hypothetical protein
MRGRVRMKIKCLVVILFCMFQARCATYYHIFGPEKSTFYNDRELEILEKTVKAIDFGYGYDPDINLNYVFSLYHGFSDFKPDDKELTQAIDGMDSETLITYSEKIYWLKRVASFKLERYRETGDWKNYTFIRKYLLPPLDFYSDLLEKQALKKDKSYADRIDKRKMEIDQKIQWEMRRREFERLWKYDNNS